MLLVTSGKFVVGFYFHNLGYMITRNGAYENGVLHKVLLEVICCVGIFSSFCFIHFCLCSLFYFNSVHAGYVSCLCCRLLTFFFKINFFKSVNQFGSGSRLTFCLF